MVGIGFGLVELAEADGTIGTSAAASRPPRRPLMTASTANIGITSRRSTIRTLPRTADNRGSGIDPNSPNRRTEVSRGSTRA